MNHLAYGSYTYDDESLAMWLALTVVTLVVLGILLGYMLGAGRLPGFKPPKKSRKK